MATPSTPNHPSDELMQNTADPNISGKPCQACGGHGEWSTFDGQSGGTCTDCHGHGIEALQLHFPAPYIKPVTKRKTGKVYQRNPMLNANDRDHFRVTSPIRKDWREKGELLGIKARVADLGWQHARIDAYIHRPINSRSDAGNFYPTVKPIIDGLIDAGLLPDDNDDHLAGPFLHKGEKGPYAVTLIITETEEPA